MTVLMGRFYYWTKQRATSLVCLTGLSVEPEMLVFLSILIRQTAAPVIRP